MHLYLLALAIRDSNHLRLYCIMETRRHIISVANRSRAGGVGLTLLLREFHKEHASTSGRCRALSGSLEEVDGKQYRLRLRLRVEGFNQMRFEIMVFPKDTTILCIGDGECAARADAVVITRAIDRDFEIDGDPSGCIVTQLCVELDFPEGMLGHKWLPRDCRKRGGRGAEGFSAKEVREGAMGESDSVPFKASSDACPADCCAPPNLVL